MPLLDEPNKPATTESQKIRQRQQEVYQKAMVLLGLPRRSFTQLIAVLKGGVDIIWDDPDPQEIINMFDKLARAQDPPSTVGELFDLSNDLAAMIGKHKPDVVAEIVKKIQPVTRHEDGSVSVDSPFKPLPQSPEAPPVPKQQVEAKPTQPTNAV